MDGERSGWEEGEMKGSVEEEEKQTNREMSSAGWLPFEKKLKGERQEL